MPDPTNTNAENPAPEIDPDHPVLNRMRRLRERQKQRHPVIRVLIVLGGVLVIIAGLMMVVLPGPAFIVLPLGIGLLSLEFKWAERLLERVLILAERAKAKAKSKRKSKD